MMGGNKEMTKTEFQKKIDQLEAELAEVKEQVEALPKRAGGVFKPEDRERYWYISQTVEIGTTVWDNYHVDHDRYAIGNCFPTEQAAEDEVRRRKLIAKAKKSQGGFKPVFGDGNRKWNIQSLGKRGDYCGAISVGWETSYNTDPALGWWPTRESVEAFIEENRPELEWYFGLED